VFIGIFNSIIASMYRKLLALSLQDPLTGAYNRRHLEACLAGQWERLARYKTPVSILLLDLDHFKQINDQRGHDAGDQALVTVVQRVQQNIRRVDTVFRLGGEEFVVLLPDTAGEGAQVVACKLRDDVARTGVVTISVGVAQLQAGESVESWM